MSDINDRREHQLQILQILLEAYPNGVFFFSGLDIFKDQEKIDHLVADLLYLEESGLCKSGVFPKGRGFEPVYESVITKDGIDLIAPDGGIAAALKIITVKLHEETIRKILLEKVLQSNLTENEKSTLLTCLKKASDQVLTNLLTELVKRGIDQFPSLSDLSQWLQIFFHP
ncbi:hypothetical protein [Entomobacter blattae]|uniref:Uncharacterized protein n=1 Tax=Entomobacter blattae TaxID=2762277 RepID=A0A7H1NUF1_9PROT|nr:hypothetical protein [Entomobacter blattae]QNT79411.1 hypothetical protein JGUZn3_22100 [Entomobacter blattae]